MESNTTHKILYVDHVQENLFLFKSLFAQKYNLLFATSGYTGLDLIQKYNIEIVISDYSMPGMTGVDFLKIVKDNYPKIKRIILTSSLDPEVEHLAKKECETYQILRKPFDRSEITQTLEQALEC